MLSAVAGARSRNIVFRVVACNKVGVLQECAKSLLVYCYGGGGVNSQAEMGFSQMFQTPQLAAAAVTCWRFQLNAVPSSAQGVQQPLSPSPCAVSSSGSASVVRPHACCQIAVLGNKVQNIHINLSNPPLPIVRPPPNSTKRTGHYRAAPTPNPPHRILISTLHTSIAMARPDSPADDSPLSSMSSSEDEFPDEVTEVMDDGPPTKRLKITAARSNTPSAAAQDHDADSDLLDGMSDVSSDTDGDVPSSPVNARQDEDDFQEQITVCAWEGCRTGDMGNMDKLVEHIHNDHIESRQKKYTCEWVGCSRKSMPHASGYALKAHMRSHTREKPFYCYLPGLSCRALPLRAWRLINSGLQNATALLPDPTPSPSTCAPSTKPRPSGPPTRSRRACKPPAGRAPKLA